MYDRWSDNADTGTFQLSRHLAQNIRHFKFQLQNMRVQKPAASNSSDDNAGQYQLGHVRDNGKEMPLKNVQFHLGRD